MIRWLDNALQRGFDWIYRAGQAKGSTRWWLMWILLVVLAVMFVAGIVVENLLEEEPVC